MKEMIYQANRKIETLDTGYCLGLLYYIMNLGTHPTAYVKIPENHRYYKKDMNKIDIYVHGGITYSRNYLFLENNQKIEGWFVGWDYIHYGDYAGYEEKMPKKLQTGGKKMEYKRNFKRCKSSMLPITKRKG